MLYFNSLELSYQLIQVTHLELCDINVGVFLIYVYVVYGMSETSGATHVTYPGESEHVMRGSVGRIMPNMQCKVSQFI